MRQIMGKGQKRGTGRTTRQLSSLPEGGVFVWCNDRLDYVERLAKHLGRDDIKLVRLSDFKPEQFFGRPMAGFDIDHAAKLDVGQVIVAEAITGRGGW